ncbi:MAG: RNA 2'-phosphotransferase [Promethearchaeota archaeon]|jgi:putative RNA 2'-phosphotransferase
MNPKNTKKYSKFLSLVLRHRPEKIGITLDSAGWTSVSELLKAINKNSRPMTLDQLKFVVENNDKKRFSFSEDGKMIRANQGHSIKVDLDYEEREPPDILWHGTIGKFMKSICKDGLKKMNRHHVHLSDNWNTAKIVGDRRGNGLVLVINTSAMYRDGHKFYLSENGVWLTDHVPPKYINSEV